MDFSRAHDTHRSSKDFLCFYSSQEARAWMVDGASVLERGRAVGKPEVGKINEMAEVEKSVDKTICQKGLPSSSHRNLCLTH